MGKLDEIIAFFTAHAEWFSSGDLETAANDFKRPLAVYVGGTIRLEKTIADTMRSIWIIRASALQRGADRIHAEILELAEVDTQTNRFPVLVRWHFDKPDSTTVAQSDVRYFCGRQEDGRLMIELVEIQSVPFPELNELLTTAHTAH